MVATKSVIIAAASASAANAACVFPYNLQYGPGVGSILYPRIDDYPTIGVPYSVRYDGTGLGPKLTFQLLRGPGENVIEQGAIATVDNCGTPSCSFSWTPASNLTPDSSRWALKLIDESNCNYQYTTQFGLYAGSAPVVSSAAPPKVSSAPVHSGSAAPAPSGYEHKPSSFVHKPKPTGSYGGKDDEDCDDEEYEHKPSAAPYAAHPSAAPAHPAAPYTPPTGGWKASNGSAEHGNYTDATPSYKPLQSNDGARFTISAIGAVVAFAAAIMVL